MGKRTVTILCSGFGLGLYIPGLLLGQGLEDKNISTEILVFENLISENKRENIQKSRKAYHSKFSLILMAQKMPMDIRQSIDYDSVDKLLESWSKEEKRDFIVLSGHWFHILDQYRSRISPESLNAEILYVDCDLPPSWKSLKQYVPDYNQNYNEVWLYEFESKSINFQIPVTTYNPIPLADRPNRFLIHGGGWGVGTYQGKIPELQQRNIPLDIVIHELQEVALRKDQDRCFMVDPSWCAWEENANGCHEFPPLSEIYDNKPPEFKNKKDYHDLLDITGSARAIIGKPGAGTMIDSLATATPLIMLEPCGEHEKKNALLWEHLGYGISYSRWEELNFSSEVLQELHERLIVGRKETCDYTMNFKLKNNL